MINYTDFVERYYLTANETCKNGIKSFLTHLSQLIGTTPISEALTNQRLLCDAFYLQKSGNPVSRSQYQKIKKYLIEVFDFAGVSSTVPTREEVIASQGTQNYFAGIDDLLNFIDKIGERVLAGYNPTADLVRVKSVCILGWLGFTIDEIANLKVSDLLMIGFNGYKISNKCGTFEVYGHPFSALYYLSGLQSYKSLPNGKTKYIQGDSDYLFKPTAPGCEKLDGGQIIQIIKRFNMYMPHSTNGTILFRNLYKNALFIEIYNDTSERPIRNKIMDIMGCSVNSVANYKNQYEQFVEAMKNK